MTTQELTTKTEAYTAIQSELAKAEAMLTRIQRVIALSQSHLDPTNKSWAMHGDYQHINIQLEEIAEFIGA